MHLFIVIPAKAEMTRDVRGGHREKGIKSFVFNVGDYKINKKEKKDGKKFIKNHNVSLSWPRCI